MKPSLAKASVTASSSVEETVAKLREGGMSYANIMIRTGLSERRVKLLSANIAKPPKKQGKTSKTLTPFAKATERVYILATRKSGIRDYELRNILHEEYGSTWDTSVGYYRSNYDSDTIKRLKAKVRERAASECTTPIFVMDWIDEQAPTRSRQFLECVALALQDRISELISEFMHFHRTRNSEDSEDAELARRKQSYAARRYLLKIAIKGFHPEPTEILIERATAITNALDGIADLNVSVLKPSETGGREELFYQAPSRSDPFLDHVESQGWLKEVMHRLI
jgi:hypothetical protein